MNDTVLENRKKIATRCKLCLYALGEYKKAVDAFQQERKRIDALPYIQEEKERLLSDAAQILSESATAQYEKIKGELDEVRGFAIEMEDDLSLDNDLMNAAALFKLGRNLSTETVKRLVEQFRGQKQGLLILKAAGEDAGLDTEFYFKDMIFDAETRVNKLDELAYRITVQPHNNMMAAVDFANEMNKFAKDFGVDLPERLSDFVDLSGAFNDALRAAAGLGATDVEK